MLSIDRHRSNLDYFAGAHDPCTHVATRRSINGRLKIRFATRQFHFDKHFLRIVLETVAYLRGQSILIAIDLRAFSASTWNARSSSSLSRFSCTFFSFILPVPVFPLCRLCLCPRNRIFPITSCTVSATGSEVTIPPPK